ncbi:hypothetical protein GLOTRDRAFT_124691 [Gloeophyllum trabeum ATCC 11539]|uniref:BTB domain-containing protein n=1 Tax=Gloeophyllum trabeum (strain ATCC 11539 / FP-39264 / Madison 617) TaxID=670483 RepID=S7QPD8_GLOTA|nr:uncharacterized protein GLOTRDRAFT_124691 [Gloeophyllum trabeum ATCC 11539]EPQ61436.1 hypothetical protein GLOTRDRAFT_124691 [Gloeophyllum trabeum ATCC 11539]
MEPLSDFDGLSTPKFSESALVIIVADSEADFFIYSIPDRVRFGVQRAQLASNSEVFRDMFACCEPEAAMNPLRNTLSLQESAHTLATLLRMLHNPPSPVLQRGSEDSEDEARVHGGGTAVIPLPVLQIMLNLADKYALSGSIVDNLHSHFAAQVSLSPLQIYAHAVQHDLPRLAAEASTYLLYPSLSVYTPRTISIIPTSSSYHKLVLLHYERVKQLKDLLCGEEIFPYGYGECPRHGNETRLLWQEYKNDLLPRLEAATDVPAEMSRIISAIPECERCLKACNAATDMLAYKFKKVIKRIDQLPST